MQQEIVIKRRYCGPPSSGNGGYSCGLIAKHLAGLSEVKLMVPPPLDTPMQLIKTETSAELRLNDTLIASARPCEWAQDLPEGPSVAAAKAAEQKYEGFVEHTLPTCFVCGPERSQGDGMRIFAGRCDSVYASTWRIDESLANADGGLNPEFLWAALDCPGYFAIKASAGFALLGSFSAKLERSVNIGDVLVVVGWPLASEGRKHLAGTALFNSHGDVVAQARATWVSVSPDAFVANTG